jgi:uncharacterized membrane protein
MAILFALITIFQLFATFLKIGTFPIALVLVPIVVGAALYGPGAGAILGGVFGAIVLSMAITGMDPVAQILWAANPPAMALSVIVKGVAAGGVSGLAYTFISKRNQTAGVFTAALLCPVVNTGLFLAAMVLFFRDMLIEWAGDTSLLYFSFIGLAGVNFLIELGVNLVLAPAALRIIYAVRSDKRR